MHQLTVWFRMSTPLAVLLTGLILAVPRDSAQATTVSEVLRDNPGVVYLESTKKFYKYFSSSLNWSAAKSSAASTYLNGVPGRLVEIRSGRENQFVEGICNGTTWLGATDEGAEGQWRWDSNDEIFSHGHRSVKGRFNNWYLGSLQEPNNSGGHEHYAGMWRSGALGSWNDWGAGSRLPYTVEWNARDVLGDSDAKKILLVTPDASRLPNEDVKRKQLFESWGYYVELLSQTADQNAYDTATAEVDVVYVSERCSSTEVNTKLTRNPVGVVTDEYWLADDLGFCTSLTYGSIQQPAKIVDTTHYITKVFSQDLALPDLLGTGKIAYTAQPASGAVVLSRHANDAHFMAIDKGARLADSLPAAGRRALVAHIYIDRADGDVKTMIRRAVDWASQLSTTVYYVRTGGDDNHSGVSRQEAFATVVKAAQVATAGDTVYVGAGTYRGNVDVQGSGSSRRQVPFIADTTGNKTGDGGQVVLSGLARNQGAVLYLNAKHHVHFTGFTITNALNTVELHHAKGIRLERCRISNAGRHGIHSEGSDVTLIECWQSRAHNNGAWVFGGATLYSQRSTFERNGQIGVRMWGDHCALTLIDSNVTNNQSYGVYYEGEPAGSTDSSITLLDCVLRDNQGWAVGTYRNSIRAVIDGCQVTGNGSGLRMAGLATITNCLVTDNGPYGFEILAPDVSIEHCTIADHSSYGVTSGSSANTKISNCILYKNSSTGLYDHGSLISAHNLFFQNGQDYGGNAAAGAGDISVDPLFVDAGQGDFHLQDASPAVDSGVDLRVITDLEGRTRPMGASPDRGCYEVINGKRLRILKWTEVK